MENFWQMLREKRPELTRSGRLVADYLLQNPQGAQNLSISQLAQVCQVAEATIFRFCRALGFEGYHEMKIAIAQANAMVSPLPTRLEPGADTATLYRYASESVVEMLSAMRGALELAAVDQAAALLKNARQVYCLGQGSGQILAKDIWSRFASLSNKFRTAGDTHMQAVAASLMGPEDTVLFVSYSGPVRDTLETLRLARGSGARVILLTYCPDTPANALADVVLRCGGGENPLDMLGMPAKIAVLFAANVLVLRTNISLIAGDSAGRMSVGTTGSGEGVLFRDGQVWPITWQRESRSGCYRFVGADGGDIPLKPGSSYINVVSTSAQVEWE